VRRALALWLLLFGVYAATVGLHAFGRSDYAGDEPHYLLAVESLADDHNVDVTDEYRALAYGDFYPYELHPEGERTDGRLNEPYGVGFPLLLLPAYLAGGVHALELFIAAIAALAVALAYRLALRVVPDPWALGAALAAGLSPPVLAYSTAVYPELTAGAALAGAALLAVRLDERPDWRAAFGCFTLLGALPWLGIAFVPAGIVIGVLAARALWRAHKRTLAIGSVEVTLFSVTFYVAINEAFYDSPTPDAGDGSAPFPGGYLERSYRLVALFLDRDYGLLRWAPIFALTFGGLWWLWRSRRDLLAHALPQVRAIELTAGLCAAALGAQLLVASFFTATMFGFWFPGRHLVAALPLAVPLVAWGFRHAPRVGSLLVALTLAASAWLYLDVRWGGGSLAADRPDAPFGPLTGLLPNFDSDRTWPFVAAAAIGAAIALLAAAQGRRSRRRARAV
jgi:hypothetical protein